MTATIFSRLHQNCGRGKWRAPPQFSLLQGSEYIGMFLNLVSKSSVISNPNYAKATILQLRP